MSEPLRPPRDEDAADVARLMSAHWPEPVDAGMVRRRWTAPGVDLERDARLGDGSYAIVEELDDVRAWIDVRGRPSNALLDWAEARAGARCSRLLAGAWSTDQAVATALTQRGFRPVRHSVRMVIDLGSELDEPAWPEGVVVRTFRVGDERVFYELFREAFQDVWEPVDWSYEEWAHDLVSPPAFVPDLWFLAVAEGEPAGFAICYPRPGSPDLGWVRILGVARAWRHRGIGRALLLHAFGAFRRRGLARAGLGVDAESPTGAHRLYEHVGMRVNGRYDIYEKDVA